jgi:hypothetical protein
LSRRGSCNLKHELLARRSRCCRGRWTTDLGAKAPARSRVGQRRRPRTFGPARSRRVPQKSRASPQIFVMHGCRCTIQLQPRAFQAVQGGMMGRNTKGISTPRYPEMHQNQNRDLLTTQPQKSRGNFWLTETDQKSSSYTDRLKKHRGIGGVSTVCYCSENEGTPSSRRVRPNCFQRRMCGNWERLQHYVTCTRVRASSERDAFGECA